MRIRVNDSQKQVVICVQDSCLACTWRHLVARLRLASKQFQQLAGPPKIRDNRLSRTGDAIVEQLKNQNKEF